MLDDEGKTNPFTIFKTCPKLKELFKKRFEKESKYYVEASGKIPGMPSTPIIIKTKRNWQWLMDSGSKFEAFSASPPGVN